MCGFLIMRNVTPIEQAKCSAIVTNLVELGIVTKKDLELLKKPLSKKEKEVLKHYLQGMTAQEIAYAVNLACRTVESYIERIKEKLYAKRKSEIFIKAYKLLFLEKILFEINCCGCFVIWDSNYIQPNHLKHYEIIETI